MSHSCSPKAGIPTDADVQRASELAREELVWRQTFKVTVIFMETAEEHEKHDDQSVVIFQAFNEERCICHCEKLEDVQLVAAR